MSCAFEIHICYLLETIDIPCLVWLLSIMLILSSSICEDLTKLGVIGLGEFGCNKLGLDLA